MRERKLENKSGRGWKGYVVGRKQGEILMSEKMNIINHVEKISSYCTTKSITKPSKSDTHKKTAPLSP